MVEKQSGEQMQAAGAFSVAMMRELMEAYQNSDVMGVADCLMEKAALFIPFYFQEND